MYIAHEHDILRSAAVKLKQVIVNENDANVLLQLLLCAICMLVLTWCYRAFDSSQQL